jgi:hypothetical protein
MVQLVPRKPSSVDEKPAEPSDQHSSQPSRTIPPGDGRTQSLAADRCRTGAPRISRPYRVEILIPPLRDRLSDIGLLAQHSSRSIFLTCPSANCRSAARRWDGRPLYRDRGRMWRRSDKNARSRVVARDGQKTKGDWHRAKPPVTVY